MKKITLFILIIISFCGCELLEGDSLSDVEQIVDPIYGVFGLERLDSKYLGGFPDFTTEPFEGKNFGYLSCKNYRLDNHFPRGWYFSEAEGTQKSYESLTFDLNFKSENFDLYFYKGNIGYPRGSRYIGKINIINRGISNNPNHAKIGILFDLVKYPNPLDEPPYNFKIIYGGSNVDLKSLMVDENCDPISQQDFERWFEFDPNAVILKTHQVKQSVFDSFNIGDEFEYNGFTWTINAKEPIS